MTLTRIFRRPKDLPPPVHDNLATRLGTVHPGGVHARPIDARRAFRTRYDVVKPFLQAHREQGALLLLFAPTGALVAQGWLRASLDKTRATIIGRHTRCSLPVPQACDEVSLRHLAVLVRAVDHDTTRIRVLDLSTSLGFSDEQARPLEAVAAEGSIFLRVGELELWVLTTHPEDPPLDDAEDAYRCIPPRVFTEERRGLPALREVSPPRAPAAGPEATHVRSVAGVIDSARRLCPDDEVPLGRLVVRAGHDELARAVGPSALDRGLLLGRYDRCDFVQQDYDRLSRVHLLVVRDGPDLLAIDTASTNGTFIDGEEITQAPLRDGTTVLLAEEISLSWTT